MLLLYRGEAFNANFYYKAGVDIDHSFVISDGGRRTLVVPKMNESLAKKLFFSGSRYDSRQRIVVYTDAMKTLGRLLRKKSVGVDGVSMSIRMAAHLKRFCKLRDASQELLMERARKREDEAACVRRAARHTREIFDSLDFKAAKTELGLKQQILSKTMEMGLEPAFEPIVATDRNSSYPHYRAGKKRLGPLVLVDYGVRYRHYCSDLTRTFILDHDSKKKEQYGRLQDICYFLVDALPDLEKGKDAALLAKDLLQKAGFPQMPHAIGHGVGLDIHEFPRMGFKSEDKLAGATLAIEPSFYLRNYGMRFEETIWHNGRRARIL